MFTVVISGLRLRRLMVALLTTIVCSVPLAGCRRGKTPVRFGPPEWEIRVPASWSVTEGHSGFDGAFFLEVPLGNEGTQYEPIYATVKYNIFSDCSGDSPDHWSAVMPLEWDGRQLKLAHFWTGPVESHYLSRGRTLKWGWDVVQQDKYTVLLKLDFAFCRDGDDEEHRQSMTLLVRAAKAGQTLSE